MRSSKILITFLILSAIHICVSQDTPPQAKLFDEFGSVNCEEVLARVDNFMIEIDKSPASLGYAVIYPKKGMIRDAVKRQIWIEGNIAFRKFDETRLLVVRGEEREILQVQFWLLPAGAVKPDLSERKWNFFTKDLNKAFIFSGFWDDYIVCPGNYIKPYIDFLADNPDARGHIVIFNRSGRYDRAEAESILKNLTRDGRLSRKRFRVFFATKALVKDYEFWVVPSRKNRAAKVLQ